jgi:hypothetical protein
MILNSALLLQIAPLLTPLANKFAPEDFVFSGTAASYYGKLFQRSNRFHKKNKIIFIRQKTLRRAADFGFILPCRFNHQPSRPPRPASA